MFPSQEYRNQLDVLLGAEEVKLLKQEAPLTQPMKVAAHYWLESLGFCELGIDDVLEEGEKYSASKYVIEAASLYAMELIEDDRASFALLDSLIDQDDAEDDVDELSYRLLDQRMGYWALVTAVESSSFATAPDPSRASPYFEFLESLCQLDDDYIGNIELFHPILNSHALENWRQMLDERFQNELPWWFDGIDRELERIQQVEESWEELVYGLETRELTEEPGSVVRDQETVVKGRKVIRKEPKGSLISSLARFMSNPRVAWAVAASIALMAFFAPRFFQEQPQLLTANASIVPIAESSLAATTRGDELVIKVDSPMDGFVTIVELSAEEEPYTTPAYEHLYSEFAIERGRSLEILLGRSTTKNVSFFITKTPAAELIREWLKSADSDNRSDSEIQMGIESRLRVMGFEKLVSGNVKVEQ